MAYIHNATLFNHEKGGYPAICDNMDGHCAKWNKSDRERQIPNYPTYMWDLKKNKTKQAHRHRELVGGCQRPGEE